MSDVLIERLKALAGDPERATDQGHDVNVTDVHGNPMRYVARPVLPVEAFDAAERAFGRPLPTLLRRLYTEVGDGGFGPGYGLHPLDVVMKSADWLAADYTRPLAPAAGRPVLLELNDWGCAIRSVSDVAHPAAPVYRLDPNVDDPAYWDTGVRWLDTHLYPEAASLESWFERWLAGEALFYAALGFTGPDDPRLER